MHKRIQLYFLTRVRTLAFFSDMDRSKVSDTSVKSTHKLIDRVFITDGQSDTCPQALVGGKARNLWMLGQLVNCSVPPWFAVTTDAFTRFMQVKEGL